MDRDDRDGSQDPKDSTEEQPVDGPGAAEGNDEPGGTSYDEPGGDEHGGEL